MSNSTGTSLNDWDFYSQIGSSSLGIIGSIMMITVLFAQHATSLSAQLKNSIFPMVSCELLKAVCNILYVVLRRLKPHSSHNPEFLAINFILSWAQVAIALWYTSICLSVELVLRGYTMARIRRSMVLQHILVWFTSGLFALSAFLIEAGYASGDVWKATYSRNMPGVVCVLLVSCLLVRLACSPLIRRSFSDKLWRSLLARGICLTGVFVLCWLPVDAFLLYTLYGDPNSVKGRTFSIVTTSISNTSGFFNCLVWVYFTGIYLRLRCDCCSSRKGTLAQAAERVPGRESNAHAANSDNASESRFVTVMGEAPHNDSHAQTGPGRMSNAVRPHASAGASDWSVADEYVYGSARQSHRGQGASAQSYDDHQGDEEDDAYMMLPSGINNGEIVSHSHLSLLSSQLQSVHLTQRAWPIAPVGSAHSTSSASSWGFGDPGPSGYSLPSSVADMSPIYQSLHSR